MTSADDLVPLSGGGRSVVHRRGDVVIRDAGLWTPAVHALLRHLEDAVPLGAALFAGDYIALPAAGLYKPIWEYDAKTLAWDLSAHLAYGAGTGAAFWLLTKLA